MASNKRQRSKSINDLETELISSSHKRIKATYYDVNYDSGVNLTINDVSLIIHLLYL